MKIPCAFHWFKCNDPVVFATHKCELRRMKAPLWVKLYLAEHCPFAGTLLALGGGEEYEKSGWKWKKEE